MKEKFGTPLSRSEMKEVLGGKYATYNCTCGNGTTVKCTGTSDGCFDIMYTACGGGGGTCTIS